MASPSELSQDCSTTQMMEHFLVCLEQERLKIDAFKRELPLCMQLLNNAMEASKRQLNGYRENEEEGEPFLEEFLPMSHNSSEKAVVKNSFSGDKANWMSSAQLWSHTAEKISPNSLKNLKTEPKIRGAFLPFSKDSNQIIPDLALSACAHREEENSNGGKSNSSSNNSSNLQRKRRRCWSPDLHRRFVNALQILGGSQVATPKQIRELMNVDGLTNDEVKSHLQKYRLHTRRPSPGPQIVGEPAPQVVVVGGIWVPPEYTGSAAIYASQAPIKYCTAPGREFYPVLRSTGSCPESESLENGNSDSVEEDGEERDLAKERVSLLQ